MAPAQSPDPTAGASGPELARAVLDAARARRETNRAPRARRTGADVDGVTGDDRGVGRDGQPRRRLRGYSGPGPDPRDPQLLGTVLARLVKARGWQQPTAEATVFGAWEKVVGPDVAKHSRPIKLENGELTVEAESTAWATQLRLLAGSLLKRIAGEVGHNVVRKLHIHGPTAPSWSRGPRRVRGRGPRDTYG
ncbi:DciA family protein [Micromonospora sp. NBC_01699]|nr:DciA family protein [Micromonospora sp. NBC_01699]